MKVQWQVNPKGYLTPVLIGNVSAQGRYYHLTASNERSWSSATQTQVYLLGIEEEDAAGKYVRRWAGSVPMNWQHWPHVGNLPRTVGQPVKADLCNVIYINTNPPNIRVEITPVFFPLGIEWVRDKPFKLIATFQARSFEADSNALRVKIAWNGQWSEDTETMAQHLVVRTLFESA